MHTKKNPQQQSTSAMQHIFEMKAAQERMQKDVAYLAELKVEN